MKITIINVKVNGIASIMFDRFIDHSKEVRPAEQKLYLIDDNKLVFPGENVRSFLFGEKPAGCAKAFEGVKGKQQYIPMGESHIFIKEEYIPITRNGKQIKFNGFKKELSIYESAGRTKASGASNTVKQEIKPRPLLSLPWEMSFNVELYENPIIDETKLFNWMSRGGILIGFGTYRPRFGRFEIITWDLKQ